MKLRFDPSRLEHWSARYSYADDSHLIEEIGPSACSRGHLTKSDLVAICEWKSPRTRPRVASNAPDFVEAVTKAALSSPNEQFRIEAPQLLVGVAWPTASVILHFCASERYPILDFRALWSLGYAEPPAYTYSFWWKYVEFMRGLSDRTGLGMRAIDQALWQYSSERQIR